MIENLECQVFEVDNRSGDFIIGYADFPHFNETYTSSSQYMEGFISAQFDNASLIYGYGSA